MDDLAAGRCRRRPFVGFVLGRAVWRRMASEVRNASCCSSTARTDDSRGQTSTDATAATLKITLRGTTILASLGECVPDIGITARFHKESSNYPRAPLSLRVSAR